MNLFTSLLKEFGKYLKTVSKKINVVYCKEIGEEFKISKIESLNCAIAFVKLILFCLRRILFKFV